MKAFKHSLKLLLACLAVSFAIAGCESTDGGSVNPRRPNASTWTSATGAPDSSTTRPRIDDVSCLIASRMLVTVSSPSLTCTASNLSPLAGGNGAPPAGDANTATS